MSIKEKATKTRVLGMENVLAAPLFRPVLEEWAAAIRVFAANGFAWSYANWIVEARNQDFRRLLLIFVGMLDGRPWDYVRRRLPARMPGRASFDHKDAEFFFDAWKAELHRHLIDWCRTRKEDE